MNLSSARDSKLALLDIAKPIAADALTAPSGILKAVKPLAIAMNRATSESGELRSLDSIRAEARPESLFAVGVSPRAVSGRKRPDFKLAVRVYAESETAGRVALRQFYRNDPAVKKQMDVAYGIRPRPRGLTLESGTSCAHFRVGGGTLGAFVADSQDVYILSCNHVLADCDRGAVDDPITQPSANDAINGMASIVGRLIAPRVRLAEGRFDAALARVTDTASDVIPCFYEGIGIISPHPVGSVKDTVNVIKCGKTIPHVTRGIVRSYELDGVRMVYASGLVITYDDQIEIVTGDGSPFSKKGDSGSLILDDDTKQPFGLLFGGSKDAQNIDRTFAHFLPDVFDALGIFMVPPG